jgi:hypothetical protein
LSKDNDEMGKAVMANVGDETGFADVAGGDFVEVVPMLALGVS